METVQVILLVSIGITMGWGISTISNHYKYLRRERRMREFYDERANNLTKDIQFWRDKCLINGCSQHTIDIYKDLLSKFMDGPSTTTDKFFMFEGKPYRPTEFTLNREEGRNETLDVTFVKSDF